MVKRISGCSMICCSKKAAFFNDYGPTMRRGAVHADHVKRATASPNASYCY